VRSPNTPLLFACSWYMNDNSIFRKEGLLLSLKKNGVQTFKWLNHAESIFNDTGLGYIFHSQDSSDYTRIKLLLNQTLKDQFIQRWTSEMINSSRGQFYSNFKTDFSFENYLTRSKKIRDNKTAHM
jgi:hypothetical protein